MTSRVYRWSRIVVLLLLAMAVVACGSNSENEPAASPTPAGTTVSAPTEEPEGDDGIVRTAWNKTGDAGNWVWDRVSGAGGWIWGGVSGAGGWLWNRVSGLPGEVADLFTRFWRWIKGSTLGEVARQTVETAQTVATAVSDFSIWRVLRYGLYALLALVVGWLLLFRAILPFIGRLPGRVVRKAGQSMQRGRVAEEQRRQAAPAEPEYRPARRDTSQIPRQNTPGRDVAQRHGHVPSAGLAWTKSQIRELKRAVTNPTIVALFDLARSSDGEPINYRELLDVTGRSASQVRADFAAFSQACRMIRNDDVWPVEQVQATDGSSRTAYRIDDCYLDWWFEP